MKKNEKELRKTQKNRHPCKNCGSKFGYPRIKTGDWVCRTCGFVEKKAGGKEDA